MRFLNTFSDRRSLGKAVTAMIIFNWMSIALSTPALPSDDFEISQQPCAPYDSCSGRCVGDSIDHRLPSNVTIGYLNCFCDPDCTTFGDCCWDYNVFCASIMDHAEPRIKQDSTQNTKESLSSTSENGDTSKKSNSFTCTSVDEISKDSFWMITSCNHAWPNDTTRCMCGKISKNDLMSRLPVVGEDGWTYRNVYCALCNKVKSFDYWSIHAHCERSAPHQVLQGEPEMLSYYLRHFCSVEMQQGLKLSEKQSETKKAKLFWQFKWRKSLRPCQVDMIGECPEKYHDSIVADKCLSYQSLVLYEDNEDYIVFKNLFCALCNGYYEANFNWKNSSKTLQSVRTFQCPVWLRSKHYDMPYWTLSSQSTSYRLLPAFNAEYVVSKWTPPSFSVIMEFRDDQSEVTYEDDDGAITIPPTVVCEQNEIYDPFSGSCRTVFCRTGYTFTEQGCIEEVMEAVDDSMESIKNATSAIQENVIGLVTVQFEVDVPEFDTSSWRFNSSSSSTTDNNREDVFEKVLVGAFERITNHSLNNVTLVTRSGRLGEETSGDDEDTRIVTFSFVVVEEGSYNYTLVTEIVDAISEMVSFDELNMKSDQIEVIVVETSHSTRQLDCKNTTGRVIYKSEQFDIMWDHNGTEFLFVDGRIYTQTEYQLLDWIINMKKKEVDVESYVNSRAAVCAEFTSSNSSLCLTYVELNQTEYYLLLNGSIFVPELNATYSSQNYFLGEDSAAICIDDLLDDGIGELKDRINDGGESFSSLIWSWVVFVLTLITLVMLTITFATYCLLRELRTVAGWNIINLVIGLFAALLAFMVGASWTNHTEACIAITIILHYLFLSTFFWNNVMAYDVWLTFGKGFNHTLARSQVHRVSSSSKSKIVKRRLVRYMMYGWGCPALIVAVCIAIEFGFEQAHFGYRPEPGQLRACWISNPMSNFFAFGIPLITILMLNSAFFIISTVSIRKSTTSSYHQSSVHSSSSDKESRRGGGGGASVRRSVRMARRKPEIQEMVVDDPRDGDCYQPVTRSSSVCSRQIPVTGHRKTRSGSIISTRSTSATASGLVKVNLMLYVRMSTVMGFTWAIGLAAALVNNKTLWHIFEASVPLQGVLIFASFVCKKRVYKLLKKRLKGRKSEERKGKTIKMIPEEIFYDHQRSDRTSTCDRKNWQHNRHISIPLPTIDVGAADTDWSQKRKAPHESRLQHRTLKSACTAQDNLSFILEDSSE